MLVTVAADETIDDTLLAVGQTVAIDGTINGDLLAFGQEVTVRGNVTGNLVTGGEKITSKARSAATSSAAPRTCRSRRSRRPRLLRLRPTASISGRRRTSRATRSRSARRSTSTAASAWTSRASAPAVSVSGAVEGDVEGYAGTITVQPSARVGGNVTGHVDTIDDLRSRPGAVVGGTVDTQLVEREQRRNHYSTVGYYVGQVVRLAGAFLTGLLLLWLFPVLREASLPNAVAVLKSAGIGLAAAVTLPVAAVLFCLTIVGIPLGMLMFLLGAIGLYFSKAVIAQIIGRGVLRDPRRPPHYAATLLVGLVIVIVAINLPWIGGLANLVLTLVGFGVIVSLMLARINRGAAV